MSFYTTLCMKILKKKKHVAMTTNNDEPVVITMTFTHFFFVKKKCVHRDAPILQHALRTNHLLTSEVRS